MKKGHIKSIMHDLLNIWDWHHPLSQFKLENKYEIDLLTGKNNFIEEDSVTELLDVKQRWFLERIEDLNGNIEDFSIAKITIFDTNEKVEIIYKGEKFEKEHNHDPAMSIRQRTREELKKLKPFTIDYKKLK